MGSRVPKNGNPQQVLDFREREPRPGFQGPGILLQIIRNKNLSRVPGSQKPRPSFCSQKPGTRCGFPFQGTRNPLRVPVLRNSGTHSELLQHERKNISKHSNVFKSVQKRIIQQLLIPRNPKLTLLASVQFGSFFVDDLDHSLNKSNYDKNVDIYRLFAHIVADE